MLKLLFTTINISESHELHLLTEDEGVLLGDVGLGLEQETALGRDMRGEIERRDTDHVHQTGVPPTLGTGGGQEGRDQEQEERGTHLLGRESL